jgi:site-specific recombinase XerC
MGKQRDMAILAAKQAERQQVPNKQVVRQQVPSNLGGQEKYDWMAECVHAKPGNDSARTTWQFRVSVLVAFYGGYRVSLAKGLRHVANATQKTTEDQLFQSFQMLWDLGYQLRDPSNLQRRHVEALVAEMIRRDLSDSVIQNRLSMLRKMCRWLGKHDVVLATATYATEERDLKRSGVADRDKSIDGAGIDPTEVIEKAFALDPVFGLQLSVQHCFGLRVKESVMFNVYNSDRGKHLFIDRGTKGGLSRIVPIETEAQRAVLNMVREFIDSRPHLSYLGWPGRSLEQARDHFYYLAGKIGLTRKGLGVTAHGFRHGYVHQLMISQGLIPPVKGGGNDQMSVEERKGVMLQASRALGHSRVSITPAYSGSFSISVTPQLRQPVPAITSKTNAK